MRAWQEEIKMSYPLQQGFTLVELMITLAIIGILSSMAIPAYMDYTARAQTAEAFVQMDSIKHKIQLYFQEEGGCLNNDTVVIGDPSYENGIAEKTAYSGYYVSNIVSSEVAVTTDGGCTITATFKSSGLNNSLQAKSLIYTLYGFNNSIPKWACHSPDIQEIYYILLPKSCQYSSFIDAKI